MMQNFSDRKSKKFRYSLIAISIVLIVNMIYGEASNIQSPLASVAGFILNPVQRSLYTINDRIEKTIDFFFRFSEVEAQNEELKRKVAENEDKIRKYNELQQENVELKSMFQFKDKYSAYNYVGTNVINRNMLTLSPTYTLDKGARDGVKKGMVVITYEGLAGQITEVYETHSILETITSENVKVSVTTAGTKAYEGILSGTQLLDKLGMSKITQLSIEADVKQNDFIVTSGIGSFYPPDLPVGKIDSVSEDKGKLMKTALVKPIVQFTGGERFYIIMPLNTEDVTY